MPTVTYCTGFTCKDGNCEGCKDGVQWCDDPRCQPYCRACELPQHHNTIANYTLIFIIIMLALISVGLFVALGPRIMSFHDGDPNTSYNYITSFDYDATQSSINING